MRPGSLLSSFFTINIIIVIIIIVTFFSLCSVCMFPPCTTNARYSTMLYVGSARTPDENGKTNSERCHCHCCWC